MVKKMLALTLALFLSLGMLQGCGNSAEEGGAQATSSPSQSTGSGEGDVSAELTALYDKVSDTSDLPDWWTAFSRKVCRYRRIVRKTVDKTAYR